MSTSPHLSQAELHELLDTEVENERTQRFGKHLQKCKSCREALESLSAKTAFWELAPAMLKTGMLKTGALHQDLNRAEDERDFQDGVDSYRNIGPVRMGRSDKADASSMFASKPTGNRNDSGSWKIDDYSDLELDQEALMRSMQGLLDSPKHPEMLGSVGGYDIEKVVGSGGMGVVFKAHDSELNRPLAIKVLSPHLATNGTARKRFALEAKAAAGVIHPNVIAVHGVGNDDRIPYIIMPYVAGPSLQQLIERGGPLPEIEVIRIGLQISAGLAAAHAQGLVHRDIKPANILVEREVNRVLITDFGLARCEDDASLTRTGWLTGTPNYMSPEQTLGERPDHRSDLFSLGCVIYFMSTGRLPFRADSPLSVLRRIQNDEPAPVRSINSAVSSTLADILTLLLKKSPEDRFQSAGELHDVLEKQLTYLHQPDVAKPPVVIPVVQRPWPKSLVSIAAGGFICLVGILGFASGFLDFDRSWTMQSTPKQQTATATSDDQETNQKANGEDSHREQNWAVNEFLGEEILEHIETSDSRVMVIDQPPSAPSRRIIAIPAKIKGAPSHPANAAHPSNNDEDAFANSEPQSDSIAANLTFSFNEVHADAAQLLARIEWFVNQDQYEPLLALTGDMLRRFPENEDAIFYRGFALHTNGKREEAEAYYQRAVESKDYRALANYNLACLRALAGNKKEAFSYLDLAIDLGISNRIGRSHLESDRDLDSIRSEPEWESLLADFEQSEDCDFDVDHFQRMTFNGEIESCAHTLDCPENSLACWSGPASFVFEQFPLAADDGVSLPKIDSFDDARKRLAEFEPTIDPADWISVRGFWSMQRREDQLGFHLHTTLPHSEITTKQTILFRKDELPDPAWNQSSTFRITQPAGSLEFTVSKIESGPIGTFVFEGDPSFANELATHGLENVNDTILHFCFHMQHRSMSTEAIVEDLEDYEVFAKSEPVLMSVLTAMVPLDLLEEYDDEGLSIETFLPLILSRVPAATVVSYRERHRDVLALAPLLISRIPAALVDEYETLGLDPLENYVPLAARVPAELVASYLDAGLFNAEELKLLREQPYRADIELPNRVNVNLRLLYARVGPSQIEQYEEQHLDVESLVELLEARVPASLVSDYQNAGLDPLEYQSEIIQRISPTIIHSYLDEGLSLSKYKRLLAERIPANLIKSYLDAELDPLLHDTFLSLRVAANDIQIWKATGKGLPKNIEALLRNQMQGE